jgi:hypothetical protein
MVNRPNSDYQGLFGDTRQAEIKNLGVENANVVGHSYVGLLVGKTYQGKIDSCFTTGQVSGYQYTGGLVGEISSSCLVQKSYSTSSVTGSYRHTGGFAGHLYGGSNSVIIDSYSTGNVVGGQYYTGGFVGYVTNAGATITNCYSIGNVSADYSGGTYDVGGFIGGNSDGVVTNSYWNTQTSNQLTSSMGTGKNNLSNATAIQLYKLGFCEQYGV